MQVTETLSDGLKRAYTVVLPAADIEGKRAARFAELGKTVRLPGFRPGKVPLPVLHQRFGPAVTAEIVQESVGEATRQVISERGLRPAFQPQVDLVSAAEKDRDLEFKVEMELLPDIAMPDFSAIELTRLKAEAASEAIQRSLDTFAKRLATYEDVTEDRPAENGDFLLVDYLGRVEGVAFPGGEQKGMNLEVGGPGFIPGFTEQLAGMRAGETRTIEVTFPDDYPNKDLAAKQASFEVRADKLRRQVTPAIDDKLGETLGFKDLEELRETITRSLQREYDELSRMRLKRQLLDALAGHAQFAAPETLVNAEFEQIWQRVEADRRDGKLDEEDAGKDEAALRAEYRAIAERRVRLGLLLSEIGRVNSITVTAEEMNRAMRAEAARYPGQQQQVMEFFRKNPQAAENLRGPIFEDKVIDFVVELAKVTEQAVSAEELAKEPPPPAPAAEPAA